MPWTFAGAGRRGLHGLRAVGAEETGHLLLAAGARIHHRGVALQRAGEDSQVVHATGEVVDGGPEDLGAEGRAGVGPPLHRIAVQVHALHRAGLRRRQQANHQVEQLANADPGLGRRHGDRQQLLLRGPGGDSSLDLLGGQRRSLQVLAEQFVVRLGGGLDHGGASGLGLGLHPGRDLRLDVLPEDLVVDMGLHGDEVHQPLQIRARADGKVQRDWLHLERALHVGQGALEVGLIVIEPAHHGDGRAPRLGQDVVEPLGPVVGPVHRRHHQHGAVRDLKRPLDLVDEGGEARGVEDVEYPAALLEGLGVDGQGEVTLLLLGICVAQEGLDEGRLPGAVCAEDGERACDARGHFVSGIARVGRG
jgi:hypothetical protein